jgi:hypothetical protein
MFIFAKFMALTSAFSLIGAVLIDLSRSLLARVGVSIGMILSVRGWLILASFIWLSSFFLSWRILMAPLLVRANQ